jgi:hypothetical protein
MSSGVSVVNHLFDRCGMESLVGVLKSGCAAVRGCCWLIKASSPNTSPALMIAITTLPLAVGRSLGRPDSIKSNLI